MMDTFRFGGLGADFTIRLHLSELPKIDKRRLLWELLAELAKPADAPFDAAAREVLRVADEAWVK